MSFLFSWGTEVFSLFLKQRNEIHSLSLKEKIRYLVSRGFFEISLFIAW